MQRGQATIEYLALVALALIAACVLVRFATPAERIAVDLAHAVAARHRHAPAHHVRHSPRHRSRRIVHRCLCPFGQPGQQPDATAQFSPPAAD